MRREANSFMSELFPQNCFHEVKCKDPFHENCQPCFLRMFRDCLEEISGKDNDKNTCSNNISYILSFSPLLVRACEICGCIMPPSNSKGSLDLYLSETLLNRRLNLNSVT